MSHNKNLHEWPYLKTKPNQKFSHSRYAIPNSQNDGTLVVSFKVEDTLVVLELAARWGDPFRGWTASVTYPGSLPILSKFVPGEKNWRGALQHLRSEVAKQVAKRLSGKQDEVFEWKHFDDPQD